MLHSKIYCSNQINKTTTGNVITSSGFTCPRKDKV